MKKAIIFGLAMLASKPGLSAGTMTIQNLPNAPEEDYPVCYDQSTGRLGNCPPAGIPSSVDIICPEESVQNAINNAPLTGQFDIYITGTCSEDIYLTRSKTKIASADHNNKATIVTQQWGFTVSEGAARISIVDLKILNGADGLRVTQNAVVVLKGNIISGNNGVGIRIDGGGLVYMGGDNTIGPNTTSHAASVIGGSRLEVSGENNVFTSSSWATLYLVESATMELWPSAVPTVVTGGFHVDRSASLNADNVNFTAGHSRISLNGNVELAGGTIHPDHIAMEDGHLLLSQKSYQTQNSSVGSVSMNGSYLNVSGNSTAGTLKAHGNSTVDIARGASFLGGEVNMSSHLQSGGDVKGDLRVYSPGSVHLYEGSLNGNTVYLCGNTAMESYIPSSVEATGTVLNACP